MIFLDRRGYVVSTETEANCQKTGANADKCEGRKLIRFSPGRFNPLHKIRGKCCEQGRMEVSDTQLEG